MRKTIGVVLVMISLAWVPACHAPSTNEDAVSLSPLSPCGHGDLPVLFELDRQIDIVDVVSAGPIRPGARVTIRGRGFLVIPEEANLVWMSFERNANGGTTQTFFTETEFVPTRSRPANEIEAIVPAAVRPGSGLLSLAIGDECTWASAGQIRTGRKYMFLDTFKPVHYGEAAPDGILPPPAPTGLAAAPYSSNSILVSWSDTFIEYGYRIEVAESGTGKFMPFALLDQDTAMVLVDGLEPNTSYDFVVYGFNHNGDSPPSAIVSATTMMRANEGAFLSMTVLEETSTNPPISALDRGASILNADRAIVWFDDEGDGILENQRDDSDGTGAFPYALSAVMPTPTSPAWILSNSNRYDANAGSRANVVVFAEFDAEGLAGNQFVALHLAVDRANNSVTPISILAGDLDNPFGRIMFSSSVAPFSSGSVQLPLGPGAQGHAAGTVDGVIDFIETASTKTGITITHHEVSIRVEFDLSVLVD